MPELGVALAPGPSGSPVAAMPETSPLTSAMNTGTPCADSCSAMSCSVLVLPVPVAPATSPWRFIIAQGDLHLALVVHGALVDRAAEVDRGAVAA